MAPDTVVKLGDLEFQRFEVPEVIPFGGKQALAVTRLIGGMKVVDAMGPDDGPLSWSGRFQGENALQRALFLDTMRRAGKAVVLTWSELSYRVVIETYQANFERFYQIPYTITCEVVENLTQPVTALPVGVDQQVGDDNAEAQALGAGIADAPLTSALGTLDKAIAAVSRFATATQEQINAVLAPIAAVRERVTTLIGTVGNTLENITTLGGLAPGNPLAQQISGLTSSLAAMNSLPLLYQLDAVTGRMATNLSAVGVSGRTLNTVGGDLYRLAAQTYGDAAAWTGIARANGLTDPVLQGLQSVRVPPQADGQDGVLAPSRTLA